MISLKTHFILKTTQTCNKNSKTGSNKNNEIQIKKENIN